MEKIKKTIPHAQLEVSRSAVLNNYRYYRSKLNPGTKMLVVVKANSYGHGATEFARLLEEAGVDYLGVATPLEGIRLRKDGIELPILVLTTGTESYPEMIEYSLEPGIPTMEALMRFSDEVDKAGRSDYPIHITLDTGMHRLGFVEQELEEVMDFMRGRRNIRVKSVYSHLAAADEYVHDDFTRGQIALFEQMSERLSDAIGYRPLRHILNTAGIERFTEYQLDMVCLGLGIYGFSYDDNKPLQVTSYFRCPIIQIKHLKPEDGTVGYGRKGLLSKSGNTIATICVGYADGLNRHLGNGKASFEVNGKMAPTIGNICMDMCMIDITGIDAQVGDIVTIFGEKPTAADLASKIATIPYEIFTSIDSRVKRIMVD